MLVASPTALPPVRPCLMFVGKLAGSRGLCRPSPVALVLALPGRGLTLKSSAESQAPNRAEKWSERQRPKDHALQGPRFAGVELGAQPSPLAAIELLKEDPVIIVSGRAVACDGDGLLGHPKVFINLVGSALGGRYRLLTRPCPRMMPTRSTAADTVEDDTKRATKLK